MINNIMLSSLHITNIKIMINNTMLTSLHSTIIKLMINNTNINYYKINDK